LFSEVTRTGIVWVNPERAISHLYAIRNVVVQIEARKLD